MFLLNDIFFMLPASEQKMFAAETDGRLNEKRFSQGLRIEKRY